MAIGDALVAPTGVQNQMVGQPSRVPGYSQGLSQAPGQMALPPEPMPIGRPTAVVGGPAYFTPAGYQAPLNLHKLSCQLIEHPIQLGNSSCVKWKALWVNSFNNSTKQLKLQSEKLRAAARAEAQAAQDARFQEMMDRIAELEGQLATPTLSCTMNQILIYQANPFPGIPDFIRDLDFS